MSQQAALYSSRDPCGTDTALQRGWSSGSWSQVEGRMEEEHLHPFRACALISVPQPRVFQRKNSVGEDAWEGRGGNLPGRQQCKEEAWKTGVKEEKRIWELNLPGGSIF